MKNEEWTLWGKRENWSQVIEKCQSQQTNYWRKFNFFFSLQFPLYVLLNHLSYFTVHYRQKKPTAEKSTLHTGRFIRFLLHVDTPSNGADLGDIYRLQLNGVHILSPPLRHRRRWRGRSLRWQRRCRESGTDNDELFNPTLSSLASCPMWTFVIFSFFAPL